MTRNSAVPKEMQQMHGRFRRWRKSHVGRMSIPERLRAAQIMRRKLRNAGSVGRPLHDMPDNLRGDPWSSIRPVRLNLRKMRPSRIPAAKTHSLSTDQSQSGTGTVLT